MKVLCDVVAPGQVHFFHHLLRRLKSDGHDVLVTARDKDIVLNLLDRLGLEHICLSRQGKGNLGMAAELIMRDFALYKVAKEFSPDVMVSQTGVSIGIVGSLLRIPRVVLEEAEHAKLQRLVGLPFATLIMTGDGYIGSHGKRERKFRGIWVQSYLHPDVFQADRDVLTDAGIPANESYIVMRTIAWDAAHDTEQHKPGLDVVLGSIEQLSKHGRVYLSHEGELPEALAPYRMPVSVELAHQLIANARMYIGEGGTMAAEAAVLGVPAVYCSPISCGYLCSLEEDYQLLRSARTLGEGTKIALELLERPNLEAEWQQRSSVLWAESDNLTDFTFDTISEAVAKRQSNS